MALSDSGGGTPPGALPAGTPAGLPWRTSARALGGAGVIVAAASFSSKILGFLRDTVLARQFGAGVSTNAYFIASQLPLVLFAAVGVAITTVFIPAFSSLLATGGQADAEIFSARVNGFVTVAVAALVLLLEIGAPVAVSVMAPYFPLHSRERGLAIQMVRIMAPLILFYAWSGVVGGVLNVRGFFGPNAGMGIPQNLIIIAAIFVGSSRAVPDIRWVAWGSLVGTLTTYFFQLPALHRSRFRVRWRFDFARDRRLLALAGLVGPAALTALAQQVGIVVDRALGSSLGPLLSDLTYANRLQLLAYSILGLSVATVLYPTLSAAASTADMPAFRRTFARGLALVNFVTVPVTIGMFTLREPLVRVLFQHHQFTAADTRATAVALAFLTLGTFGYGWQDYMNRAFFALQDTRTPMLGGFIAVAVNVGLDFILVHPLRQGGLALGTASGWTCAAAFLAVRLRRRIGLIGGRELLGRTLRMLGAALCGLLPAVLAYGPLASAFGGVHSWLGDAAALVAVVAGAAAIYVALCSLLRVPEAAEGLRLLRGAARRLTGAAGTGTA